MQYFMHLIEDSAGKLIRTQIKLISIYNFIFSILLFSGVDYEYDLYWHLFQHRDFFSALSLDRQPWPRRYINV